jgi:hypothetical protein
MRGVMIAGYGRHGARHGAFGRARWPILRQKAPDWCFIQGPILRVGPAKIVREEPNRFLLSWLEHRESGVVCQ